MEKNKKDAEKDNKIKVVEVFSDNGKTFQELMNETLKIIISNAVS